MLLVALLLLIVPLLKTPAGLQEDAAGVKRWMTWGVACALSVLLPCAAVLLYMGLGDPRAAAAQLMTIDPVDDEAQIQAMVSRLAARLRDQPKDLDGWTMLARSYEVLGRYDDAAAAYRKAIALAPESPQLLADYADALGSAQGGDLSGPAQAAIDAALKLDPDHPKALALAGMAAFKQGDMVQARRRWERLAQVLPPDSVGAQIARENLERLGSTSGR
jgi:cytochrome c-type biogenesis protein CcmH